MKADPEVIFLNPNQLRILTFTEKHITSTYVGWLNNKDIVRYSETRHLKHTYESCYAYWQSFQNTPHFFLAIECCDQAKWMHVGNINAYVNVKNNIADIGILIGEERYWGKGIGLMAWKAVCNYLFAVHGIRKITGGTLSNNKAMLKIMKRAGMIEDGRRIRHYICDGEEVDICHYALFSGKNEK